MRTVSLPSGLAMVKNRERAVAHCWSAFALLAGDCIPIAAGWCEFPRRSAVSASDGPHPNLTPRRQSPKLRPRAIARRHGFDQLLRTHAMVRTIGTSGWSQHPVGSRRTAVAMSLFPRVPPGRCQGATEAAPRQPICVFTKPFNSLSFDTLADRIAECGFDGIEAPIRKGGHVEPAEAASISTQR